MDTCKRVAPRVCGQASRASPELMHTPQQLAAAWHRHAAAIKRQAYAFELRPLWPRNERRASSRAGRAHDGTKPMQHACRPAKGTPAAEAAALRQRSAGRQPLDGCLRPSSPSPPFSPLILPPPSFRACLHLSPTPTQVMAAQPVAARQPYRQLRSREACRPLNRRHVLIAVVRGCRARQVGCHRSCRLLNGQQVAHRLSSSRLAPISAIFRF